MQVLEHIRQRIVILEPTGRLTVETETDLKNAVRRQLDAGRVHIVLDLIRVPYIDSCGLGAMVQGYVSAQRLGGFLQLQNVKGRNLQLLTITRLLSVFEVYQPEASHRGRTDASLSQTR